MNRWIKEGYIDEKKKRRMIRRLKKIRMNRWKKEMKDV